MQQLSDSKIASMVESKDFRKGIVQLEWLVSLLLISQHQVVSVDLHIFVYFSVFHCGFIICSSFLFVIRCNNNCAVE